MKIISDFRDYYFPFADGSGPVFILDSKGGPNKREQFALLDKNDFTTIPHGLVKDLAGERWAEGRITNLVVYEDENVHCGEGKKLIGQSHYKFDGNISRLEERERLSNLYCSAFLHQSYGLSWRRLQIGPHCFWIEYKSFTDWRSNVGEGEIKVIGVEWNSKDNPFSAYPLWAVDFVLGKEMYAIDFNIAPGIRGTGVEKYFTGKEVCDILEKSILDGNK